MGEFFDIMEDGILNSRGEFIGSHFNLKRRDSYPNSNFKCVKCRRGFHKKQGLSAHNKAIHKLTL